LDIILYDFEPTSTAMT